MRPVRSDSFAWREAARRVVVATLVVLASSAGRRAYAGDGGNWRILGFSEDGQYVSWERSGIEDGSESARSDIYILDVERNRSAVPAISVILARDPHTRTAAPSEEDARKINLTKAKALLKKLGIDSRFKAERRELRNRRRVPPDDPGHEHMARTTAQLAWRDTEWTLVLQEVADKRRGDEGMGPLRMFDLRLSGGGTEMVLQKDMRLPRSRGAVYAYDLGSVWTYRSSLIVVISYLAPGFEAQNWNVLLVTAKVP